MPTIPKPDTKQLNALADQLLSKAASIPLQFKEFSDQAAARQGDLVKQAQVQVASIRKQAEAVTSVVRQQVEKTLPTELRKQVDGFADKATSTCIDLVDRGEKMVAGLLGGTTKSAPSTSSTMPSTPASTASAPAKPAAKKAPASASSKKSTKPTAAKTAKPAAKKSPKKAAPATVASEPDPIVLDAAEPPTLAAAPLDSIEIDLTTPSSNGSSPTVTATPEAPAGE